MGPLRCLQVFWCWQMYGFVHRSGSKQSQEWVSLPAYSPPTREKLKNGRFTPVAWGGFVGGLFVWLNEVGSKGSCISYQDATLWNAVLNMWKRDMPLHFIPLRSNQTRPAGRDSPGEAVDPDSVFGLRLFGVHLDAELFIQQQDKGDGPRVGLHV